MSSPRSGLPTLRPSLRRSFLAATAALGFLPAVGCQVEYAGMTLPSGKYMQDDVQYFAPGPTFPWANTQAATQRARMAAMGEVPPAPGEGNAVPAVGTGTPPNPVPIAPAAVAPLPPAPGGGVNLVPALPGANPGVAPGAAAPGAAIPPPPPPGGPLN